jgi:ABC-type amino acid transport substrate-binding protein
MRHLTPKYIGKAVCGLCILAYGLSLSPISTAEKHIQMIYGIDLVYRLSENGTTQYNALLNELAAEGLDFNTLVRPLSRSQPKFKDDKSSCIFPATSFALTTNDASFANEKLISSTPIDRVSLRLLTKENDPVISHLSELRGKKIAVINGLNPEIFFSELNVFIEQASNEETRIRMLNADRIDAVLGFVPDAMLAAEALDLPVPQYNSDLSFVSDEGVSIICHDTITTKRFINEANRIIDKLKASGKLRRLLGPHADIVKPPITLIN